MTRSRRRGGLRLGWPAFAAALTLALTLAGSRALGGASRQGRATAGLVAHYGYRVVRSFPHDPEAFTQGLIYRDGDLYESTGLNGRSSLRHVRLETGDILRQVAIDDRYFAEGLTDWHDSLVQVTWQSHVGFVYGVPRLDGRRTFAYDGEGWGLTQDGARLILSDGSSTLRFLDPETFGETGRVTVTERGVPVENLNELEWIKGSVAANIWETDDIVFIAPDTGQVTARLNLAGLGARAGGDRPIDVLNGIAYDPAGDRIFVTGKLWPRLFQIEMVPQ